MTASQSKREEPGAKTLFARRLLQRQGSILRLYEPGDVAALTVLSLTTCVVALILLVGPLRIGLWADDTIYLATSKALADGRGYRHPQLPGEPWQTKYPILFPLVLAGIWHLAPDFPQNVRIMQVFNVLMWAIGSWFCYLTMRRSWGLPRWLLVGAVVLAFLGTSTLPLLQAVMSEALYFCLTMAALFLVTRLPVCASKFAPAAGGAQRMTPPATPSATAPRTIGPAALIGLVCGLAFLTRPIAVTLIVAVLGYLLLRRQWRQFAVAALPIAACVLEHKLWLTVARGRNASIPVASAFGYDLGYGPSSFSSIDTLLWVVYQNTSDMALSLAIVLNPFLSEAWIDSRLSAGLPAALPLYAILIVFSLLVVLGGAVLWRAGPKALHLYVLCYVGLLWVWLGSPWRFLIVILPILTVFALTGVYLVIAWGAAAAGRHFRRLASKPTQVATVSAGVPRSWPRSVLAAGVVIGVMLACGLKCLYNNTAPATLRGGQLYDRALEELCALLKRDTPPDAVICANTGGYLHLRTGRKFVPYLAYEDSIPFRYPPDRRFAMCGRGVTESQYNAYMGLIFDHLVPFLETTRAGFLALKENEKRAFEEFRQTVPGCFSEVTSARPYTLYRVRLPCEEAR